MYNRTPITDAEIAAAKRARSVRLASTLSAPATLHPDVNPSLPRPLQLAASRNLFARDAAEAKANVSHGRRPDAQVLSGGHILSGGFDGPRTAEELGGRKKEAPPAADFADRYNDFSTRYNERLAASAAQLVSTPPVRTAAGGGAAQKQGPDDPFDKFLTNAQAQRTNPASAAALAGQSVPSDHAEATAVAARLATVHQNDDGSFTTTLPSGGTATTNTLPAGYLRQQLHNATTDSVGRPLPFTTGNDKPVDQSTGDQRSVGGNALTQLGGASAKNITDAASDIKDRNTEIKSLIDTGDFSNPAPAPSPTPKPEDNPKVTDLFKQRGYVT